METPEHLPRRLDAVLTLIPPSCTCVADIGYDHGRLIRRLAARRPSVRVIGVEKQAGAAERYRRKGRPDPARVDLRRGDGLGPLRPGEAEVAVFAGLGEPRIVGMLERAPAVVQALRRMVFAPLGHRALLRPALARMGWRVTDERIAYQGGRYYLAIAAEPGGVSSLPAPPHPMWLVGPTLFERRDPHLYGYLCFLRDEMADMIAHADAQPPMLAAFCRSLVAGIKAARAFRGPGPDPAGAPGG